MASSATTATMTGANARGRFLGFHVTLGTILIRSIVDDRAATRRIRDPKTDER